MEVESILKTLVLIIGFYMSWNIGANDVSNAMGTSVGSGALTLKRAVILAAILEFSGAFFVGSNVSETMQRGLINTDMFLTEPTILVLGMSSALMSTSIWLQIASYYGWPVSTTHAIVGAIIGFGGVVGGVEAVRWEEVLSILVSWVLSPLISAVISYILFYALQRKILFAMNPAKATLRMLPYLTMFVFGVFTLSLTLNGIDNLNLHINFSQAFLLACIIGALAFIVTYLLVRRKGTEPSYEANSMHSPQSVVSLDKAIKHLQRVHANTVEGANDKVASLLIEVKSLSQTLRKETNFTERTSEYRTVENKFVYLQILSACFVAFAHGANDVANAIGPVAAVLDIIKNGAISDVAAVPPWLLAFGGIGIVIGLATWGWRVIETIGKKITELTPTRGFCAEFGAATTILVASKCGLPISTTHCLVGAVLGVGLARGIKALNLSMLKDIVLSWIITIPASAIMSILVFYIMKMILGYVSPL
ncbi:MAG: inorganic phosphate transporter [Chlamydiae bacterium]|nr:inorganic phosphate transporter [Chlamydiota bacterium]